MNSLTIDLDSLTAARAEAYTAFLLGLADAQRGEPSTPKTEIWKDSAKGKHSPVEPADAGIPTIYVTDDATKQALLAGATSVSVGFQLSPQQVAAMDETAGLVPSSAVPPVPAPSTAAAAPLPTAPEAQQDGAPATPSASTPPAPPVPMPPAPPAPAGMGSPASAVEVMHRPDGTVESVPTLDSRGLPWDERIHSSNKSINADKTWRARRNMSDAEKAAVPGIEAELRQRVAGEPAGTAVAGESTSVPAESNGTAAPVPTPSVAAPAASAPPLPPAPPAPAPNAPAPVGTAAASDSPVPANAIELTMKVTKLGNLLGADELQRACASVGLPDTPQAMLHLFAEAQKDPTLVGRLNAEIDEILAS